jgi:hypothetical protein
MILQVLDLDPDWIRIHGLFYPDSYSRTGSRDKVKKMKNNNLCFIFVNFFFFIVLKLKSER